MQISLLILIGLGVIFLASSVSVSGRPVTQTLAGTVTDDSGGVIANAQIAVHWDKSGADVGLSTNVGIPNDLILQSNKMGQFQAELPPGFYDVFISAMGFSPQCRKMRIKVGHVARYDAKLKVDSLVINELGDRFEAPK